MMDGQKKWEEDVDGEKGQHKECVSLFSFSVHYTSLTGTYGDGVTRGDVCHYG